MMKTYVDRVKKKVPPTHATAAARADTHDTLFAALRTNRLYFSLINNTLPQCLSKQQGW